MVITKLWNEIEKHINTDYGVTGWILYVINHIRDMSSEVQMENIIFR